MPLLYQPMDVLPTHDNVVDAVAVDVADGEIRRDLAARVDHVALERVARRHRVGRGCGKDGWHGSEQERDRERERQGTRRREPSASGEQVVQPVASWASLFRAASDGLGRLGRVAGPVDGLEELSLLAFCGSDEQLPRRLERPSIVGEARRLVRCHVPSPLPTCRPLSRVRTRPRQECEPNRPRSQCKRRRRRVDSCGLAPVAVAGGASRLSPSAVTAGKRFDGCGWM